MTWEERWHLQPAPALPDLCDQHVFKTIETEARVSGRHLADTGKILFQDILKAER
jgi:hypothetical protein